MKTIKMDNENKKELIRVPDESKIKQGEIIFDGWIVDKDGNLLRPVPHIITTEEEYQKQLKEQNQIYMEEKIKSNEEKIKELDRFIPLTVGEILDKKFPKNSFLVENLIPNKSICVLSGYEGTNKSWILMHLAQCIASKKPFLGNFKTKKGAVLIVEEENGEEELKKRIKMLGWKRKLPISIFSQRGLKVDNPVHLLTIENIVKSDNVVLVIFDPFIAVHSKAENTAEDMQRVMESFQKINLAGATVIFAQHHRKDNMQAPLNPAQSLRGSSAIIGRVDSHLEIKVEKEDDVETILNIIPRKSRKARKGKAFKVKMNEIEKKIYFEFIGEYDEKLVKIEKAKKQEKQILDIVKESGKAEVVEILNNIKASGVKIGENNLRWRLKKMKAEGALESKNMGHNKEVFYIKETENPT